MKKLGKKYCVILLFIIIISNFITTTFAVEQEKVSSLEINFITENNTQPMDNVNVSVYKLASLDDESYVTKWQDIYSNYEMDIGKATDEEVISKAIELADYVKTNNIEADYVLTTDSNGKNKITFENGIYLICGAETVENNVTYTPMPCIIQLPYTSEFGDLIYDASVALKYERKENEIPAQSTVEDSKNNVPRTGDIIQIVALILLVVIVLNIIQVVNEKKNKNKNK